MPRWPKGRGRREPAQALATRRICARWQSPVMKGHEDDGIFLGNYEALPGRSQALS